MASRLQNNDPPWAATTLNGILPAPITTLSTPCSTAAFAMPDSTTLTAADTAGGASLTVANATALGAESSTVNDRFASR